ncbi:unnamed protein product [Amoebophrya sp. A25]|nr:unnamed protein product [Amoebophrya sp. A25]|eukprot:GSA25T00001379001.1
MNSSSWNMLICNIFRIQQRKYDSKSKSCMRNTYLILALQGYLLINMRTTTKKLIE